MKIKRFFANEMRDGIRQVRKELGADAVILSNHRVDGGIEIIAAVDYDEALLKIDAQADASGDARQVSELYPYDRAAAAATVNTAAVHNSVANNPVINKANNKKPAKAAAKPAQIFQSVAEPSQKSRYINPDQFNAAQANAVQTSAGLDDSASATEFFNADYLAGMDYGFDDEQEDGAPAARLDGSVQWAQEPTLVQMQNEMRDIRDLLEQQLASLAWGELKERHPVRAKLTRGLLELGLSPMLCKRIIDAVEISDNFETAWRNTLALVAHKLPVDSSDVLQQGGIIALIGATGVGKTTTIAKLAARYALRHGSDQVAMITTDSYRIGAHEQLRTYGNILDIPVRVANNQEEIAEAIKQFSNRSLILIDTAGMSQRDSRLIRQLELIKSSAPAVKSYLVISTSTHRAGINEAVKAFAAIKLDGCILTKLDETTSLGGALSIAMEHNLNIVYVSDGQRVPEDIHLARGHSLISRALKIAKDSNQTMEQDTLNLAFSGMVANAHG